MFWELGGEAGQFGLPQGKAVLWKALRICSTFKSGGLPGVSCFPSGGNAALALTVGHDGDSELPP